jgi:hypothetical protein
MDSATLGEIDMAGEITALLDAWNRGDMRAYDQLFQAAGEPILRTAEREQPALRETVIEMFRRFLEQGAARPEDAGRFAVFAAQLLRQRRVGEAAVRAAQPHEHQRLHPALPWIDRDGEEMDKLDRALDDLARIEERKARVFELRFFLDFSADLIAGCLGSTRDEVERDVRFLRAWLHLRLRGPVRPSPPSLLR